MGMQCCFVIRKPDFYYLLFEKAVVQTTARTCPYLSHLERLRLIRVFRFGVDYKPCFALHSPAILKPFLPHAFNCYSNENITTVLPMNVSLIMVNMLITLIVRWRKELGYRVERI